MRRRIALPFLFTLLSAAALAPALGAPPAGKGETGVVVVKVRGEARTGVAPKQPGGASKREYGYPDGASQFDPVDYAHLDGVVVWLEPAQDADGARCSARDEKPALLVVGKRSAAPDSEYQPALLAIGAGQRVEFRNASNKPATLYCLTPVDRFAIEGIGAGSKAERAFERPGTLEILEPGREDPTARIVVAPTRFVRKTRAGESVRFEGVPAGKWRVRAWHERLPGFTGEIEVAPGASAEADAVLTVNGLPGAP